MTTPFLQEWKGTIPLSPSRSLSVMSEPTVPPCPPPPNLILFIFYINLSYTFRPPPTSQGSAVSASLLRPPFYKPANVISKRDRTESITDYIFLIQCFFSPALFSTTAADKLCGNLVFFLLLFGMLCASFSSSSSTISQNILLHLTLKISTNQN